MNWCLSLILKLSWTALLAVVGPAGGSCQLKQYYDPHTRDCHPCSECEPPRTPNQFCIKDCQVYEKCAPGKYYDLHTKSCHLCTECKPPRTPNEFCLQQCPDYEQEGRTTPLPLTTVPTTAASRTSATETVIVMVLCSVMGTVIVVLIVVGLLYFRGYLHPKKYRPLQTTRLVQLQHPEPVCPSDQTNHVEIVMHSLPVLRSSNPGQNFPNFSLPAQHHQPDITVSGTANCNNSTSNNGSDVSRSLEPTPVALFEDVDHPETCQLTLQQQQLEPGQRTDGCRFNNISRMNFCPQDKSMHGNVVCQPEQQEHDYCQVLPSACLVPDAAAAVHGTLSPSNIKHVEGPHLSFDPNKGCECEDQDVSYEYEPEVTHHGTSLKSSC